MYAMRMRKEGKHLQLATTTTTTNITRTATTTSKTNFHIQFLGPIPLFLLVLLIFLHHLYKHNMICYMYICMRVCFVVVENLSNTLI